MGTTQNKVKTHEDVVNWLHKYGYHEFCPPPNEVFYTPEDRGILLANRFDYMKDQPEKIYSAISCAQYMGGLREDGIAGPITKAMMSQPRCECPDFGPGSGRNKHHTISGDAKWPQQCSLTLSAAVNFSALESSSLSREQMENIWHVGFEETMRVCNVKIEKTDFGVPSIHFLAKGGPTNNGVLAWAEFPQDCNTTSNSCFGTQWDWSKELLEDTSLHEQGHQLGLPHLPKGNVMYYTIDQEYGQRWQKDDIAELLKLYGKPLLPPIPDDPGEPDVNAELCAKIALWIIEGLTKEDPADQARYAERVGKRFLGTDEGCPFIMAIIKLFLASSAQNKMEFLWDLQEQAGKVADTPEDLKAKFHIT